MTPGKRRFIDAVVTLVKRSEEDLAHALRWGWAPGSLAVRHFMKPVEPAYGGLQWWLDASGTSTAGVYKNARRS